jgi:hypothetical protein
LGSVIIHQTLYDMFPLDTVDPDLIQPLTPNEFIQRILVPEVGMRLVLQDLNLDVNRRPNRKRAVRVLRESASYGVAMFPEDGGDWASASGKKMTKGDDEVMGVADRMVMERACKRRKELEIEEAEEGEIRLGSDAEERPYKRWEKAVEPIELSGDEQKMGSSKPFVATSSEYFVPLTSSLGQTYWLDRQEEAQRAEEKLEKKGQKATRGTKKQGKERATEPVLMDQSTAARPKHRSTPLLVRTVPKTSSGHIH